MEFRLTYEGLLLGANNSDTRAKHKHEIRKVFHRQLRALWDTHPYLKKADFGHWPDLDISPDISLREGLAALFTRNSYRFVPLVSMRLSLICTIEVLFLRPEPPGTLLQSGGHRQPVEDSF